jgi:hypothetical protein
VGWKIPHSAKVRRQRSCCGSILRDEVVGEAAPRALVDLLTLDRSGAVGPISVAVLGRGAVVVAAEVELRVRATTASLGPLMLGRARVGGADKEIVVEAAQPRPARILDAAADLRDVCVALWVQAQRDARGDGDVRHLEAHALRRAAFAPFKSDGEGGGGRDRCSSS